MEHGPHFNEEHARKAVMKMENEDGTRGPHWSIEETTTLASQYGISLTGKYNRYDWYVALNMVYSDYYRVIMNITGSNNTKHYVEFAKAWLNDKDIDEGKMWYYYIYVMCDKIREAEMECYEEELEKHEGEEEPYGMFRRGSRGGRGRRGMYTYSRVFPSMKEEDFEEYNKLFDRESDGIKCKLPNTVSVPYPQLTAINTDIYRAAAYGAYAGDVAYGRSGYGCGCNNYWG